MATASVTTGEKRDVAEPEKGKKSLVIVDLGEAQSHLAIKRLRKGKGKLLTHVEQIVDDLTAAGTIKHGTPPVVIVVTERPRIWPFDDDDDD